MFTLTVLVGLPGSGKSTYLNFVDDPEFGGDVFVYSTDNYIEAQAKEAGKTYNDMFRDHIDAATKHMNDVLAIAISAGIDVIWDQTNMSSKKRIGLLSRFPKKYRKICICRVPPRDENEWSELNFRILQRAQLTGKMVPSHIVEKMADSYVEPTLDEGFDEVQLYDIYGNKI